MFHTHFFFLPIYSNNTTYWMFNFFLVCLSDLQSKQDRRQPGSVLPDPSNIIPEQSQVLI